MKALLGVPVWLGPLVVGGIVIVNVVGGGMRSITFVQAFQYWLKLTAVAVPPALVLLMHFGHDHPQVGGPLPPTVAQQTVVTVETDVVVTVVDPTGLTVNGPGLNGPLPARADTTSRRAPR